MKRLIIGLSLSIAAASGLSAQTVYYPANQYQHTAYPDSWTGGPPIVSPGGQRQYGAIQPTYYAAPVQTTTTHSHNYTHTHGHGVQAINNQLLVPTHRVAVGNHRLISGPCGWGGNCTTYDGDNFTYIHPANQ